MTAYHEQPRVTLFRSFPLPNLGQGAIQVCPSSPYRQRVIARVDVPGVAALLTSESNDLERPDFAVYLGGITSAFGVIPRPVGSAPVQITAEAGEAIFATSNVAAGASNLYVIVYPTYFDACDFGLE